MGDPNRRLGTLGIAAYLGVYVAWQLSGVGNREVIGDFAFLPLTAVAALAAWRAGKRSAARPGLRRGWRLIALALAFYGVGDAIQLYYEAVVEEFPTPSLADPFFLAFYPLFFAGILSFPWSGGATGNRRAQAILEAATIAVGGAAVIWYLVLGPTAYADAGSLLANLVGVAYPAGDLILVGVIARLWFGARGSEGHRVLALISAGVALYIVADVVYSWMVLQSVYAGGGWIDGFWMFATAAFALAAASQPELADDDDQRRPAGEADRTSALAAVLPYLAVVTVFGLLLGSQAGDSFFPGMSLALTAALAAALLLLRQALAQRDLAATHRELRKAHAKLAALATIDPLTGLSNHRALVDTMDRELDRARRHGRPCSLLFIDIDYFKTLNDSCGHAAGDKVLKELGGVMAGSLRSIDTLGRWGGEEFVVVLPEVAAKAALQTAERARATVAEHLFAVSNGTHLTISVGVAAYPRDGEDRDELLEAADRAMYTAKRMGRNQVFDAADPTIAALREDETAGSELDERATMGAVDALAMLVDNRDNGAGEQTTQVATLAKQVALALRCSPKQARQVYLAAKLHDIGKVAVADAILRKPGRLTDEEWEQMRRHPAIGADVISRVSRLADLAPIIRSHHERYDGDGYPAGLKGDEIPLEARIVGVADALDAMLSNRPYRARLDLDKALEELRDGAGSQFDPAVVEAMEQILDEERTEEVA
jgi:diguanylate cyclase (GGDEF)-like protein